MPPMGLVAPCNPATYVQDDGASNFFYVSFIENFF
jgi:hypothetical protein